MEVSGPTGSQARPGGLGSAWGLTGGQRREGTSPTSAFLCPQSWEETKLPLQEQGL